MEVDETGSPDGRGRKTTKLRRSLSASTRVTQMHDLVVAHSSCTSVRKDYDRVERPYHTGMAMNKMIKSYELLACPAM